MMRDGFVRSRIWFGANHALWAYDLRSGALVRQKLPIGLDDAEGRIHINDALQQADGSLWLGTWGDGLIHFDPATGASSCHAFDSIPPFNGAKNIVFGLARRSADEFYVAAHNGLWTFHARTHRFELIAHDPQDAHSLLEGNVLGVFHESNGTLWCCTQSGLSCMAPDQNLFHHAKLGPAFHYNGQVPSINGVVELDDQWLLATDVSGLLLLDKRSGGIKRVFHADRSAQYQYPGYIEMFRCGGDSIELRSSEGAFLLDPKTWKMRHVLQQALQEHGNVNIDGWSLCCEGEGWAWTGTRLGCYRTNGAKGELIAYDEHAPAGFRIEDPGLVAGIARDHQGNTWFMLMGTGIACVPAAGSPVKVYRADENPWMLTPQIWELDIDAQDRLWIGTREYGLIVTPASDPGGADTRYLNAKDGMTCLVSTVMATRHGDVWAGGGSGLFRISSTDFSIRGFGPSDGLSSADFFAADMREHPSGLVTIQHALDELIWFHPDSIDPQPPLPPVRVEKVLVNGETLPHDSTYAMVPRIDLGHDRNFVDIHFSAIALTQRHHVALEYRLNGSAQGWVKSGASGVATFTGLPPGQYTFEVRNAKAAGETTVTKLFITIHPAFWQTWWFQALVALCAIAIITIAIRWRLRTVRRQERLRSDFERRIGEVEMSALRAQMNPHFLFNSLNSINRYIVKHEPRIASEYLTKFSRLMRSVLNNSKERLVPLKDDLDALLLYIDLESLRFTNKFELVSNIELEDDPGAIMVPPLLLQPYVENAIWHGLMHKKEGAPVLKVAIRQQKDSLRCEVEDNGLGRAHAAELRSRSSIQRSSMGTRITQDRLDLLKRLYNMNVSVVYTDLMDAAQRPLGTRVTITLQREHST